MQLEITLSQAQKTPLPYSSSYHLYAAVIAALTRHSPKTAENFHNSENQRKTKLLAISPLNSTPHPEPRGDGMIMLGDKIYFRLASPLPEIIYGIGEALLAAGKITVQDKVFNVVNAAMVNPPMLGKTMTWRVFGQAGGIHTSWNDKTLKKKIPVYPDSKIKGVPTCEELLADNLRNKLLRLQELRPDILASWDDDGFAVKKMPVSIEILPMNGKTLYGKKMYNVKGTNVLSWRAPVRITACDAIQRIAFETGLGSLNTQGHGLVTISGGDRNAD